MAQSIFDAALTELEVARTAVESAQVRIDKLTILAPFSGTLGFRTISVGAYVTAGTALVQLDKIDLLKVSFSVPELEQSRIRRRPDQSMSRPMPLPGERFTATVSAIDPSIDVNGRALLVRADLDNQDLKLRPGLLVRVTVKGAAREAVMVPEAAIVQRGDNAYRLSVADDAKAKRAQVRVGKRTGRQRSRSSRAWRRCRSGGGRQYAPQQWRRHRDRLHRSVGGIAPWASPNSASAARSSPRC